MAELILWKNQEMDRLKRDIDRLFFKLWDDFRMEPVTSLTRTAPFIDITEGKDSLTINAEIPGIDPDDIDVSIFDDTLTIKGEIKRESIRENESYYRRERSHGYFTRSLQLPCKILIEQVKASYKKGILSITLPKCKAEEPKAIKIKVR